MVDHRISSGVRDRSRPFTHTTTDYGEDRRQRVAVVDHAAELSGVCQPVRHVADDPGRSRRVVDDAPAPHKVESMPKLRPRLLRVPPLEITLQTLDTESLFGAGNGDFSDVD